MATLINMPTLWDINNHANFIKADRAAYWFSMLSVSLLLLTKAQDTFHKQFMSSKMKSWKYVLFLNEK